MEYVYGVNVGGKIRYVGRTNNLRRRQLEHRSGFKGGKNKLFYNKITGFNNEFEIELILLKEFKNRVDAKRWECLLILTDYFGDGDLWQKVPRIGD